VVFCYVEWSITKHVWTVICFVDYKMQDDGMKEEDLKKLFQKMDKTNSGFIGAEDYRRSLRGYASRREIQQKIHQMDENLDGRISFAEFSKYMSQTITPEPSSDYNNPDGSIDWFSVFVHFDADGSGTLDIQELRQMAVEIGYAAQRQEVIELFENIDTNADGKISYGEFIRYYAPSTSSRIVNRKA